jgi:enoyl-CoA hydratase/carnithine racemase
MTDAVLYRRDGAVGVITFNRPDNRNSMTPELLDGFDAALAAARGDDALRCLVITGSGSSFSAGADFRSQVQRGEGRMPHERSYAMYEPFLAVLDVEVPVIAALGGHAIGGGFGLALACDLRIAATGARYGANFCRLGLSPGMAISFLLPRLVGVARAAELMFTGRLFDGDEAAAMGLALEALPADQVLPRAIDLATTIAENAPLAVRLTKQMLREGLAWEVRRHAAREAFAQAASLATADATEGMTALLEKRTPEFHGQ